MHTIRIWNQLPTEIRSPEECDLAVFTSQTLAVMASMSLITQMKLTTVDHGRPRTTMVNHELTWSTTNYHGQKPWCHLTKHGQKP